MDEHGYHGYGMNRVALDPPHARQIAARRGEVLGLATHGATYLLVCGGLLVANLLTSPEYLWALWPLFGWGIGVASHAAGVLGLGAPHGYGRCGHRHRHSSARLSSSAPWSGQGDTGDTFGMGGR